MASIEARTAPIEALTALDADTLAMLDALVAASGWNQTADDWALFAEQGKVRVMRAEDGRIVASGATLPMADHATWIGMILVLPEMRGAGLGRAMFKRCLQAVQDAGRAAMLDATPAGEALYLKFGFAPLWRLTRWRREAVDSQRPAASIANAHDDTAADLDGFLALDAEALGFARAAVMGHLLHRNGSRLAHRGDAFGVLRAGRSAQHIGPLLAQNEASANALLGELVGNITQPILIDVPDDRPLLQQSLAAAGFVRQRGFARMALGGQGTRGQGTLIHAIAGPEFG